MKKNTVLNLDTGKLLVAPSILASDFSKLGDEIKRIDDAGCDLIHLDVMDGHFVPNITFGPPLVKSIRKYSDLCFDAHLMISEPLKYIEEFAAAGADHITFHIECDCDPNEAIEKIKATGCSAGVSVKPMTPASAILPLLDKLDLVLVMTVEPGFGGQSFMANMMPKTREIKDAIKAGGHATHLQIDGGIDTSTVIDAATAGANMMVAGTSVFRNPDGATAAIKALHDAQSCLR